MEVRGAVNGAWGVMLQFALVLSLVLGTIIAFPAWNHHSVKAESPIEPSEAAARGWMRRVETAGAAHQCMAWSMVEHVHRSPDRSGWFASVRCNTPMAYGRVALGYLVPGLMFLGLVFLARRAKGRHG